MKSLSLFFYLSKAKFAALLFLSILGIVGISSISKIARAENQDNVNYFLIQTAAKASIEKDKNTPNGFIITLKQIKPFISYFSDRPNRETGQLTIKEYLALWQKKGDTSFQKIPPNAILQAVNKSVSQEASYYAIELKNPQYDEKTGTLRYQATSLPGNKFSNLTENTELEQVTVLIDEVCLSCW